MDGDIFRGTIQKYMALRHINTREQLRAHTTIGSNKTFGRYWNDPELIPIGEFLNICRALKIPNEERISMLNGKERKT